MKKCKNCGQEFEDGANVCPVCGAADNGQSAKVCPNCKTEVSDNSNFCTNCGTPINGSAQSNNGDAQNNAGQNNYGGQNFWEYSSAVSEYTIFIWDLLPVRLYR